MTELHIETRGGKTVVCRLTWKNVRNINFRIGKDNVVSMSVPMTVSRTTAEAYLRRQMPWIEKHIRAGGKTAREDKNEMLHTGDRVYRLGEAYTLTVETGSPSLTFENGFAVLTLPEGQTPTRKRYEALVAPLFQPVLKQAIACREPYFYSLGIPEVKEIRIRYTVSFWGRCYSSRGILVFSTVAFRIAPDLLDYLICHEFTHFIRPDHSASFYRALEKSCPNHRECRRRLKASSVR
ncbi:MAG: M48 family metallopeptidase [Clostridia bacterium]|nr:M48 family metallopeptidase [Clostridia bacterium]